MALPLADYEREQQAFDALLQPECRERILLFRGESGSGKTTLLNFCREQVPPSIPHVEIQLRGSAVSVAEIFFRAGRVLRWDHLPNFTEQVAALEGTPKTQIDRNWLIGINNRISVVMRVENPADREHRRAALTDAWFDDTAALPGPMLMLFDTYEQATTEVQDWISGPFLARAAQVLPVRVVVAGQTVPDKNNIEWGHCCTAHDLYGVAEARHWMPIVQATQRHIPFDQPLTWLAGVCHALKGNPKSIMQVIEGLPVREMHA